jgi:hypothetical protein
MLFQHSKTNNKQNALPTHLLSTHEVTSSVRSATTWNSREENAKYTGHTQNNGAVLIVNTIKTAPFFCVCPVHLRCAQRVTQCCSAVYTALNQSRSHAVPVTMFIDIRNTICTFRWHLLAITHLSSKAFGVKSLDFHAKDKVITRWACLFLISVASLRASLVRKVCAYIWGLRCSGTWRRVGWGAVIKVLGIICV